MAHHHVVLLILIFFIIISLVMHINNILAITWYQNICENHIVEKFGGTKVWRIYCF